MAQTKAKTLAIAALVLLFGGTAAVVIQQTLKQKTTSTKDPAGFTAQPVAAVDSKSPAAGVPTNAPAKVLVFRNIPSWNRNPDFEDALVELGVEFEVKSSAQMGSTDLSPYRYVVIPGAQWRTDFYRQYTENAERFDRYVTNGGTLVFELNGAENDGIPLPRGISMVRHGAKDNALTVPDHPILAPLGGKPIRANFASHGYLLGVPKDAIVLATESVDGQADVDKPTFVEYAHGQGRVIAACQCFHDQDRSGRGILMQTVLNYAGEKRWFTAKN